MEWIFAFFLPMLPILLLLLGLALVVGLVVRLFSGGGRPAPQTLPADAGYQALDQVLAPTEQAFLEALEQVLAPGLYRVLVRVPLSQVVEPTRPGPSGREGVRALLEAERLDVLICRARDSRPLCAVALQDRPDPAAQPVLAGAGLAWVHIPRRSEYRLEEVESTLAGHVLTRPRSQPETEPASPPPDKATPEEIAEPAETPDADEAPAAEPPADSQAMIRGDGTPLCPRCYAPMVPLGEGGSGETGEPAHSRWRCSRFPRCTTELPQPAGQVGHNV